MIDRQTQDQAWACAPKAFRDAVKEHCRAIALMGHKGQYELGILHTYEGAFGSHNLTSDAEPEEVFVVPKKEVQSIYSVALKSVPTCEHDRGFRNAELQMLKILFGTKCLPDGLEHGLEQTSVQVEESKAELSQNSAEKCDNENLISKAEPKFKRRDKVKIVGGNPEFIGKVVEIEAVSSNGTIVVYLPYAGHSTYKREYLEPYTVPPKKRRKTMETIDRPTNSLGASESKVPTPELPLTPDETAILQEIHTSLSSLYTRLSAISEDIAKREEAILRQSRCNAFDDKSAQPTQEAIDERLCSVGIEVSDPNLVELGHSDSPGPKGCNPYIPIGSIMMDLLRTQDKIERLIHIKSPQTTLALESLQTCLHLSDDGSTHGRIDKSTDTRNCL